MFVLHRVVDIVKHEPAARPHRLYAEYVLAKGLERHECKHECQLHTARGRSAPASRIPLTQRRHAAAESGGEAGARRPEESVRQGTESIEEALIRHI